MSLRMDDLNGLTRLSLSEQSGYYDRGTLLRHGIVWEF